MQWRLWCDVSEVYEGERELPGLLQDLIKELCFEAVLALITFLGLDINSF